MAKYINADDCYKYFYEHLNDEAIPGAMNAIDDMPAADVVEVLRCKDCKYRGEHAGADFWKCEMHGVLFKPYDYCSYGKRRESE